MKYVLITPARNEAEHIEKTIRSVISQTILPEKWIIVSDGSTDGTDDIAREYSNKYRWMELIRMPEHAKHNFSAKVFCFNAGYERIKNIDYDVIANLDADISFGPDHFEFLLDKLKEDPDLGVVGTRYTENGIRRMSYSYVDVAGQCQVFRRKCFEQIGGYTPIKYGGIDWVATVSARMKGWKTMTFDERDFIHHRIMGTAPRNKYQAYMHFGREDYIRGNHPLWEVFRGIYQGVNKPYIIGGLLILYGFLRCHFDGTDRIVSDEVISFHRQEQIYRLSNIIRRLGKLNTNIGET